ncbi:phosphoglycerate kinase [Arenimonas sp.]|nr:phosphoglycerate kinase [Candidatus Parcubacteria bacterium]
MDIKNKKVLLRADFNVPIKDSIIGDNYRIVSTIPTLEFLRNGGAKTIIISHIETKNVEKPTLRPVFEYLKHNYADLNIEFVENVELLEDSLDNLADGGFLLLENIRNFEGEKNNSVELAENFKSLTEIYINDAFAVSHRDHMSVSALPALYDADHKIFGFQMQKEIDNLSKILIPKKPFAIILSGAKFSTKLPLIEKYLVTADKLFIGGALLNNVLKSLGYTIGKSLIDTEADLSTLVTSDNFLKKVYIPQTVVVKNMDTNEVRNSVIREVKESESIMDVGSVQNFVQILKDENYETIVWNGPLGYYEEDVFKTGTLQLAKGLIEYVIENKNSHLFIGGGDTVGAIQSIHIDNDRIFISTGGGAMLEFLEKDGKLPGVVNIK